MSTLFSSDIICPTMDYRHLCVLSLATQDKNEEQTTRKKNITPKHYVFYFCSTSSSSHNLSLILPFNTPVFVGLMYAQPHELSCTSSGFSPITYFQISPHQAASSTDIFRVNGYTQHFFLLPRQKIDP